jgi:uncharacterized protein
MTNRLASETSPYLRQHAENPVDWYPWGNEALKKAKAEDKPIFLSIGYSACHWCHVMAHESFEDPRIADILSKDFVSIKVDREERPDLDEIYMTAVQAMTGQGGWPMSMFLTPDGQPFYGGTYFPPASRGGMPSFIEVLRAVADAWRNRRTELEASSQQIVSIIAQQQSAIDKAEEPLRPETLLEAVNGIWNGYDKQRGGWGGGPKFPQPMGLEFLLSYHHRTGDAHALQMVTQTLEAMARGGIYDQIGGGFHRYSVDGRWLVPHFEKMLYDNALLARVYLHAWQVTGNSMFRAVAEETLDFVLREMTDQAGGFYSTLDADSEGKEGKFYVWTAGEVRTVLSEEAAAFVAAYGVTDGGNFEGRNILTFSGTVEERRALAAARRRLFEVRDRRLHPGRDEKMLTSWNGLTLAAFAEAGRVLNREDYLVAAERNAAFLLDYLRTPEGRLRHSWKEGSARVNGYLADHSHLIEGLLELYHSSFAPRWYLAAKDLAEVMIHHFGAPSGFYDTSDDHETLIVRPRDLQDNAVPSGGGMTATVLLRLAGLAAQPRYMELAQKSIGQVESLLAQHPLAFGQWLIALEHALSHPREIAIVGEPGAADTRALLRVCTDGYHPSRTIALGNSGEASPLVELLEGRTPVDGHAAAYVCVDYTCLPPVTEVSDLEALLV